MVEKEEIVSKEIDESEPFVAEDAAVSTSKEIDESEPLVAEDAAVSTSSADANDVVAISRDRLSPFDPWGLSAVILAVLLAMIVMKMASPTVLKPKSWTAEELSKYNGTSRRQPLVLSILGSVFDVSQGRNHYGPGGAYHHFTGRDASRAFVSGNFSDDGLTDLLQGLTPLQIKSIFGWRTFFENKYLYVGTLVGTFYDESGKPTDELIRAERQLARAEEIIQDQKRDEERFPSCNSWWNAKKGAEVWCKTGYPRIVDKISEGTYKGTTGTRCACYEEQFLHKEGLRVYEGCAATAQRCQSAPPEAQQG